MNHMKNLYLLLLVCSTQLIIKPVSEEVAIIGSLAGGITVGALAGLGSYSFIFHDVSNKQARIALSTLVGLGIGGIKVFGLYNFLHNKTPQSRYEVAYGLVNEVVQNPLIIKKCFTSEQFFVYVAGYFGTSWPLVLAREKYLMLGNTLKCARKLLKVAQDEIRNDKAYSVLSEECNQLADQILQILHNIDQGLEIISTHDRYNFQVNLYEKDREANLAGEHYLALQRQKYDREGLLQQQKLNHTSVERNKDRAHEVPLQNGTLVSTLAERERDRIHNSVERVRDR